MTVKQLSVFIENRPGRLSAVTKILGDNDVNIRAMSLADTKDFGILRLSLLRASLWKEPIHGDTKPLP